MHQVHGHCFNGFLISMESEVILMNNPLFVGIDVSKKDNHVNFINRDGEKLNRFSCSNNLTGISKIVENIRDVVLKNDMNSVIT